MLLLSAYNTASHHYWCEGLMAQFSQYEWTYLSLPARYFAWRMRGNGLSWTYENHAELHQPYDLIVATSMVDLATLRGLNPQLHNVPALLYFHENQFAYPVSKQQADIVAAQMVSLYSAITAQRIVFNSEYNRSTFFDGLAALLKKLPDHVPKGIVEELTNKSSVLFVPLVNAPQVAGTRSKQASAIRKIVWNHRWEYDKGPEQLLAFATALPQGLPIKVHVVGQQFRQMPEAFAQVRQCLQDKKYLGEFGFIANKAEYLALLGQSDFVLSTALHDFQGLSILEAVQVGCVPIVPNRLAYQEIFDAQYRYPSRLDKPVEEAVGLIDKLQEFLAKPIEQLHVPSVAELEWRVLKPAYEHIIEHCRDLKTGRQGV
ncbi:DUF3524 domain-containing protein [Saccharophagus degradans]|nr:DUF3524 domain-containing protein [Saccharophagus degradans]